jgi:adenine deaminase
LKGAKSTSGADLFAHLQEVFKKLILHYPADALEKIEEVSYLLKHQQANGGLKVEDFLQLEEIHNYSNVAQGVQAYIDKMQGGNKKVIIGVYNSLETRCW